MNKEISINQKNNEELFGIYEDNNIVELSGSFYSDLKKTKKKYEIGSVRILPPVTPNKIIGLGYNYKDLIGERDFYDEPIIFLKPSSSIIGNGENIVIPEFNKIWIEVELGIVINKLCKYIIYLIIGWGMNSAFSSNRNL